MPVEYRTGDLFLTDAKFIAHGCNCQGVMGAGIAVQFKKRYPEMFTQYRTACQSNMFIVGSCLPYETPDGKTIYNLGTQSHPGACATFDSVYDGMATMIRYHQTVNKSHEPIAIPRIGCGLGGLNWRDVKQLFEKLAASGAQDLIVYSL